MKFHYFFDPYCGWCYGFAPVLHKFSETYPDTEFEYVTGGMIVGEREGVVSPKMAQYIVDAQPRLTEYTGSVTGDAFLDKMKNASMYFSSIRPSLAIQAAKALAPDRVMEYSWELQKKHFIEGDDLQANDVYVRLAEQFEINASEFTAVMSAEETRLQMSRDFMFTANCGINGFPALVLQSGENYYLLCRGYAPLVQLQKTYDSVMTEIGSH